MLEYEVMVTIIRFSALINFLLLEAEDIEVHGQMWQLASFGEKSKL